MEEGYLSLMMLDFLVMLLCTTDPALSQYFCEKYLSEDKK